MKVLSHRGYWRAAHEKNTPAAFSRSFGLGFGTETDVRDSAGRLVISHDVPAADALECSEFLELHRRFAEDLPLALNIKADGLQTLLRAQLERFGVDDYFVFDMSVPDARLYVEQGFRVFTRQSEWETDLPFYDRAAGVWVDGFLGDWVDERTIGAHLRAGKHVCLVSPELHGREPDALWERLRGMAAAGDENVMICTDRPEEARAFFGA